jgi:hypothetical protein
METAADALDSCCLSLMAKGAEFHVEATSTDDIKVPLAAYNACYLLPAAWCLVPAACCPLSAVCCLLSTVCCLLSAGCLLSAVCHVEATSTNGIEGTLVARTCTHCVVL